MDEFVSSRQLIDWQTKMSNSAHQREVADLQASGLNPVLSAHGSGASTPSGASDSLSDIVSILGESVSNTAKALGSGSGRGHNNLTDPKTGLPLADFFNSLPDKGNSRFFGISLPNSTWKYLYNTYGAGLEQFIVDHGSQLTTDANSGKSLSSNAKFKDGVYNGRFSSFGVDDQYNATTAPSYGTRVGRKLQSDAKNQNVFSFVVKHQDNFSNLGEAFKYWKNNHKK